jgi:hypothetical protein
VVGSLDDRVDQQRHRSRREHEAAAVELAGVRIARGGDAEGDEPGGQRRDGHHREEDARPRETLDQPAAEDRPGRDRDPRGRTPEADRPRTLGALYEHVGDDRERGWKDHRGAQAHEAACRDQLPRRARQAARRAAQAEDRETREQHALAAEAVREAAGGQQQRGEHEVVRIDDPLQLAVGCMQLAHQRGQRDVDDRRVEVDREGGEQERRQDQWAVAHWDVLLKHHNKKVKLIDK